MLSYFTTKQQKYKFSSLRSSLQAILMLQYSLRITGPISTPKLFRWGKTKILWLAEVEFQVSWVPVRILFHYASAPCRLMQTVGHKRWAGRHRCPTSSWEALPYGLGPCRCGSVKDLRQGVFAGLSRVAPISSCGSIKGKASPRRISITGARRWRWLRAGPERCSTAGFNGGGRGREPRCRRPSGNWKRREKLFSGASERSTAANTLTWT